MKLSTILKTTALILLFTLAFSLLTSPHNFLNTWLVFTPTLGIIIGLAALVEYYKDQKRY